MSSISSADAHQDAAAAGRAWLILIVVIFVWGINWPIMKLGLDFMPPFWFAFSRVLVAALAMFAAVAWAGRLVWPHRHEWPLILSLGLLQTAGFMALVNWGLQFVPAGRSAVLAYTTPLWVTPGAVLFLDERLNPVKLVGLALGLAGVVALFNPFAFDWSHRETVIGNAALMVAAVLWAAAILHTRGHRWHHSPLQLVPWQLLTATLPLLLLALAFEDAARIRWAPPLLLVLAYNGFLATSVGFWGAVTVQKQLPAVTASLALLAVPLTGVLASTLWLGEPITATLAVGIGLVLGGVALVNFGETRRR